MELPAEKITMIKRAIRASTAQASGEEGDFSITMGDLIRDDRTKAPDQEVFDAYERRRIQKLLDAIDEREGMILKLRYGLEDGEPMTLRAIGERLGITRERVRQIEKSALTRLSEELEKDE